MIYGGFVFISIFYCPRADFFVGCKSMDASKINLSITVSFVAQILDNFHILRKSLYIFKLATLVRKIKNR